MSQHHSKGGLILAVTGLLAAVCLGGLAVAQVAAPSGYLGEMPFDAAALIGPPPAAGSPRAEADRAIFRATRAMKGTPRWDLAVADFEPRRVAVNFSCSIGVQIDPATMPKTMSLITRLGLDVRQATYGPKRLYGRSRPYKVDPGETCGVLPATEDNFDYPSGHAALGWALGLVLAEMLPERSTAILVRGRAVGDGRIVCGVHNSSSVMAGQTIGAALVAAEQRNPDFQADFAAAKAELEAAIKARPLAEGCDAEAKALAGPAW